MLECCDKCQLKWISNVVLETLKHQHHVIQHSWRSQASESTESSIPAITRFFFFFQNHFRSGTLSLHSVEEKRMKEREEFHSYSKWKGMIWPILLAELQVYIHCHWDGEKKCGHGLSRHSRPLLFLCLLSELCGHLMWILFTWNSGDH